VISERLRAIAACPICLEPQGCLKCGRQSPDHARHCGEQYANRARCSCGGPDKVRLVSEDGGASLSCPCCANRYPIDQEGGFADLAPRSEVGEGSLYEDHEFHERLGVTDAPPLLSARVKFDMMARMLDLRRGDVVIDLGSGAGKFSLFTAAQGATPTGIDLAPYFLDRAARTVDLVKGDLRRLPFRKGSFPKGYTLDVLEHLEEDGVSDILVESRRTLAADGRLFVYTHAMESSRIASFQRFVNRLAKRLGERGLIDHEREAMRKSDHRNAIRSHEHFDALCAAAGLKVTERRYYNVFFKAVIEDLVLRLIEQRRRRRDGTAGPTRGHAHDHGQGGEMAPAARLTGGPRPSALAVGVASVLTWLMKLDVVLFGRVRTGPFFGRLEPVARTVDRK
jgi:SAM-dependent methyltransferase